MQVQTAHNIWINKLKVAGHSETAELRQSPPEKQPENLSASSLVHPHRLYKEDGRIPIVKPSVQTCCLPHPRLIHSKWDQDLQNEAPALWKKTNWTCSRMLK